MSVGVCVINRNGIALSSDSAATLTVNRMFYNTVNKLFKLSNKYTCGVIIYGDISFYNVSVEQVIKEFSAYLDSLDCFDDLYDIVSLFEEFISEKYQYYRFDQEEAEPARSLIKGLVDSWGVKINKVLNEENDINKAGAINEELKNIIQNSQKLTCGSMYAYLSDRYRDYYEELLANDLQNLNDCEDLKQELWDNICGYFSLVLEREKNKTGILFAGYGVNDAYPKLIEIETRAIIGGTIKYWVKNRYEAVDGLGRILPLAQQDVVNTFCKGISKKYIEAFPQYISEIISDKVKKLPESFTTEQKEELLQMFSNCSIEFIERMNKMIRQENINPLMNSVTLITLPEMAFLAESLVNITTLKRTYSLDGYQQTVGGPTDVAVISKADGFTWIKKK